MTGPGLTRELATGYAAALKALRRLDTANGSSATEQAALRIEVDRADAAIAASPTGPGANEVRELLAAICRHHNQHRRTPSVELTRAFHKARWATFTTTTSGYWATR
jgi:hypothetical protein